MQNSNIWDLPIVVCKVIEERWNWKRHWWLASVTKHCFSFKSTSWLQTSKSFAGGSPLHQRIAKRIAIWIGKLGSRSTGKDAWPWWYSRLDQSHLFLAPVSVITDCFLLKSSILGLVHSLSVQMNPIPVLCLPACSVSGKVSKNSILHRIASVWAPLGLNICGRSTL